MRRSFIALHLPGWRRLKRWCDGDAVAAAGNINEIWHNPHLIFTQRGIDDAAANGHLEVVRWLHTNKKLECSVRAIQFAAAEGHLDTVIWLYENMPAGCPMAAMEWAMAANQFPVVHWFMDQEIDKCEKPCHAHGQYKFVEIPNEGAIREHRKSRRISTA